jgi:hypothetical protein
VDAQSRWQITSKCRGFAKLTSCQHEIERKSTPEEHLAYEEKRRRSQEERGTT